MRYRNTIAGHSSRTRPLIRALWIAAALACNSPGSEPETDTDADSDTDTDTDTDTDPPAPPRLLYLSPWTTGIGRLTFEADSHHHQILDDPAKVQAALDFIADQGVNEVALYNLNRVLPDQARAARLGDFIVAARGAGITRAVAIGASTGSFDEIAVYQTSALRDRPEASFDGLLTEIEFWNDGGDLPAYLEVLDHMGALELRDRHGDPMLVSTYQGWLHKNPGAAELCVGASLDDDACIAKLVSERVDRVLLHAYQPTPERATGYGVDRFQHYRAASPTVELLPIFSLEGETFSAGAETFMGEWLCTHKGHGLPGAERAFAATGTESVEGFAHYSYFFADMYLNEVDDCP